VALTKPYLQEILYNITNDTKNTFDVYDDKVLGFFFILISNNVFLVVDNSTAINIKIVNEYSLKKIPVTANNPQGVSFTLKTNTATVRNLSEVLFAAAYDRGSVSKLSDLFMYKVNIDAEAVFTTPLYLTAQPHIFVRYGPFKNAAGNEILPADRLVNSGFVNKVFMPWTEVVSKRGAIDVNLSLFPAGNAFPATEPEKVGLIR